MDFVVKLNNSGPLWILGTFFKPCVARVDSITKSGVASGHDRAVGHLEDLSGRDENSGPLGPGRLSRGDRRILGSGVGGSVP